MPSRIEKLAPRTVALFGSSILVLPTIAFAQAADAPNPPGQPQAQQPGIAGLNPESFYGKEPTEGVYVRDSASAVEKLMLAQKMERLKEWNKSADLYQEVITKYFDRVVPSQKDQDNKIYQYTSITNPVQEQLSRWPQEGLDVYRARYETPAAAELEKARPDDAGALNRVYSIYFVTDAGKQAGIRLIDLYMEDGEYPAAAWIGDRLLNFHPNLNVERPAVLFRTALAYAFAGDQNKAKARLKTLQDRFANERGVVRGKDVILADALAKELQKPHVTAQSVVSDSWPILGGDASRGRVSPAAGKPGARLYGVTLSKPALPGAENGTSRQMLEGQLKSAADQGLTLGVMPVVDRGELYFQDGQRLYALSLESGVPLPGWAQTYPDGAFTLSGVVGSPRAQELCVTLTEHEVLAIMGMPDNQAMLRMPVQPGEAKLVCLDRATGKQKWIVSLSQAQGLSEAERSLHMAGSPLIVGDGVLVFGSAGKQAGFEDAYVLCFDLSTGKHRWSTYIASASVPNAMFGMQMPRLSDNASHLAYANGRVYVQTNLGALAALDAYSGGIAWLDIYPTDRPAEPRRGPFWNVPPSVANHAPRKPWAYNPAIVRDGYAFVLPTDSKNLLIYDAGSGIEFKRIDLRDIDRKWRERTSGDEALNNIDTLLGVTGDRLLLAGDRGVICLKWKEYDRDKFDPNDATMVDWVQSLPQPIRGRGFLSSRSLFVPCSDRLYCIDLRTGKSTDQYPRAVQGWEEPEGPGNVIATSEHVIVAGANSVNVYTDLAMARAKLDREVATAPREVQPHLKYAEVMLAAGEADTAIEKLDEAIKLLGGARALQPGPMRDRLFTDALTFAQKLAAEDQTDARQHATQLFDRAALAADSPTQQVNYRLARAKFTESNKHPDQAIKLYQEILSDAKMRPVSMVDSVNGLPTQASSVAETAIANLIRFRPSLYEPIQHAAIEAYKSAADAKDDSAAKLMEVAQTYPNSSIAQQAMLAAADAYESARDSRQAIQVLRQMWFKYPDSPERARILESMARNYFAIPNHSEAAAAALARAASLPGEPRLQRALKLPDGKTIDKDTAMAAALDVVRRFRGQEAARSLPDFNIPIPRPLTAQERAAHKARVAFLPQGPNTVIENIAALLVPLRENARTDRIVAWSKDGKLEVFAAGQTKPLMTSDAVKEQPRECAWVGDALLVWSPSHVISLNPENGQAKWELQLKEMPSIEVAKVGGEAQPVAPRLAGAPEDIIVLPNGQMLVRRGGRIRAQMMRGVPMPVLNRAGQVQIPPRPPAGAAEQVVDVRPVGDRVLVTTTTGRVLAIELGNGHIAWQMRLTDRPVDRLVANEDFTVVRVSDDTAVRIAVLDTATGQLRCGKSFGLQAGMVPVNMALASDGTLVYTLPDRLCLKDLYKPWPDPSDREVSSPPGAPPFAGASLPDQLLIAEGRILALAQNGSEKFVNIYSLETGQPVQLRYKSPRGDQEVDRRLNAGKSWNVLLRLVGPHLYVVAPGQVLAYNLDHPEQTWASFPDMLPLMNVRDLSVGQKHLAVLEEDQTADPSKAGDAEPNPTPVPPTPDSVSPAYRLYLFRRTPVSEKNPAESGVLDYNVRIADPSGIRSTWQAAEGAFYYLTADGKLHMLKGAGGENAER